MNTWDFARGTILFRDVRHVKEGICMYGTREIAKCLKTQ
jgi:hypothetical protein